MRTALITMLFVAACSGVAQSETRYDLYIFQAHGDGPQIYAFAGGNTAVAVEVRGCGDVALLPNAATVASDLSARRHSPETGVVTVEARGSRVELGGCGIEDEEPDGEHADDRDSLVVIENASGRQMRRIVQSLDAAPTDVRNEIIATLGLS